MNCKIGKAKIHKNCLEDHKGNPLWLLVFVYRANLPTSLQM